MASATERKASTGYEDQCATWNVVVQNMREYNPTSEPYEGGFGDADVISTFDGPSGLFNRCTAETGSYAMPPVDKVAMPLVGVLEDFQFATLVQAILKQRVGLVIATPDCGAWYVADHALHES